MAEIIPAINVRTFEEVQERVKKVEPYVKWCHLDVTDGIFSKHLTWHDPRDLSQLSTSQVDNFEVHLMVSEPEKIIDQWLVKPIKRVIVHLEAVSDMGLIIKKCRTAGVEIGIAINPETFWGKLEPWFEKPRTLFGLALPRFLSPKKVRGKADIFQVLAVHPGPSGQEMSEEIYEKVIHIRKACPGCIIEVDGGINLGTAKKAVESGANLLVAGVYLFGHPDIKTAIETLRGPTS